MKENKSKRSRFRAFVQSTNFLFIVSIVISLVIWIYMSISTGNDTSLTISDIPVQVELSEDAVNNGLQVFSGSDYKASLTVTGNRAVVGSLQASDITVKAAANYVDSAGNYTLYLNASKNDPYSDFQISSAIKPSTIDVLLIICEKLHLIFKKMLFIKLTTVIMRQPHCLQKPYILQVRSLKYLRFLRLWLLRI